MFDRVIGDQALAARVLKFCQVEGKVGHAAQVEK
jgi:hypothetical protein